MADAKSVQDANDGVSADGKQLPWRTVHFLREAKIGDLSSPSNPDQESPNTSSSLYDQIVTLAKILTRRYNGKDIFDMICEIHNKVVNGK
jgi:hypothetical protein